MLVSQVEAVVKLLMLYPSIIETCQQLSNAFEHISPNRKLLLERLAAFIIQQLRSNQKAQLTFICTHNSRRSHFGQIWAGVAAAYYRIPNIYTFSGGTEATAFHPNALKALQAIGFDIAVQESANANPTYYVKAGNDISFTCFSKEYKHPLNPQSDFAAVMTCSDAEENCPYIPGATLRIGTTYEDPKAFDHTPQEAEQYLLRCKQIATEQLYVFSVVKLGIRG